MEFSAGGWIVTVTSYDCTAGAVHETIILSTFTFHLKGLNIESVVTVTKQVCKYAIWNSADSYFN